jgi:hypothetical protein
VVFLMIATVFIAGLGSAAKAETLTTLFASDNQFAGNTFDLVAIKPLTIDSFDVNIGAVVGSVHTVDIYYRVGTAVGNEANSGAWTLLGSDTNVICQGINLPTPVAVGGLSLLPDQVYGIYIIVSSFPSGSMAYTNGGPTEFSDENLTLTTNTGEASPPFSVQFFPRQWNGNIHYTLAPPVQIPTMNEWGMIIFVMFAAGAAVWKLRNRAV